MPLLGCAHAPFCKASLRLLTGSALPSSDSPPPAKVTIAADTAPVQDSVPSPKASSPKGSAKGGDWRPIKPVVKSVDPSLLFNKNRTEPKRGDPNLVRIGECFIGRYEVVRRLGSGDWSTVWLGYDKVQDIFVALKVSKETRSKALHEVNIYNQV